jgi:transcriptional regulator with AAA-type ATPase domain
VEKQNLQELVKRLRGEGKSIRAIAEELGVHRSRVHRAMKALTASPNVALPSAPVTPGSLGAPEDATFVGRQQEMAELKAALQDTLAGRGRLIMLAGQPGIGKTRTAQEFAAIAYSCGAQVLWGRCYMSLG